VVARALVFAWAHGPPMAMKMDKSGSTIDGGVGRKGRSDAGAVEAVLVFDLERSSGPHSVSLSQPGTGRDQSYLGLRLGNRPAASRWDRPC
jgi:hypothetical protein